MTNQKVIAQSSRIVLQEFSLQDAEDFFQLNSDPLVMQFTGDQPFKNIQAARDFIEQYRHYELHGYGRWSVRMQTTQQFIGFCGLRFSSSSQEVDLGFRLMRSFWNQGLATEAAKLSIEVGFNHYQLPSMIGRAMQDNSASLAVLSKLDFVAEQEFVQDSTIWSQFRLFNNRL